MTDELLDIFTETMQPLGTATRNEAHTKGYWHQVFHCWVIHREGDQRYLLFQKRSAHKKLYPNMFDMTAGGHLTAGETLAEGVREVNEELGLSLAYEDLSYLGICPTILTIDAAIDREFAHVFLYESLLPLDEYQPQVEEVAGIFQMELMAGMEFFAGERLQIPMMGYLLDEKGNKQPTEVIVSQQDFIWSLQSYYLKILIMAERYWEGKKYLSI